MAASFTTTKGKGKSNKLLTFQAPKNCEQPSNKLDLQIELELHDIFFKMATIMMVSGRLPLFDIFGSMKASTKCKKLCE